MSRRPAPSRPAVPTNRCAIYTRKSTEEGLEQEFNTLDAQRESAESYIASQKNEGWARLPDRYDDGGFTGGNMDRPALKRLMADIEAGKIDCVVVYKVDRLSRSLIDFARMMEVFERQGVSFVSVTQQFNTANSMGRLMFNVLLSFAQFEREIISERTRDKIAATRRKGKWAGGHPILGYDVDPQRFRLAVNEDEAERVRQIFALYLEHQALLATVKAIESRGWVNKQWTTRKGKPRGDKPFDRNSLFKLLTNVVYLGKVRYKAEVHAGEHDAIVDADIWQRVQHLLTRNGRTGGAAVRNKHGALLKGLLFGEPDVEVRAAKPEEMGTRNGKPEEYRVIEVRGIDVYDPTTGEVRSGVAVDPETGKEIHDSRDDVACWFLDTDYNGENFFVRHAYFTGADDPYAKLKRAMRAEIDGEAWELVYSTRSWPFPKPTSGKIAVKVVNHYGDEVMQVYTV